MSLYAVVVYVGIRCHSKDREYFAVPNGMRFQLKITLRWTADAYANSYFREYKDMELRRIFVLFSKHRNERLIMKLSLIYTFLAIFEYY